MHSHRARCCVEARRGASPRARTHTRTSEMALETRRRAVTTLALAWAALAVLAPPRPADATLVAAVEAVTRGLGARINEFKGGEALVVTPADIEGLLNTPCGEWGRTRAVASAGDNGLPRAFFGHAPPLNLPRKRGRKQPAGRFRPRTLDLPCGAGESLKCSGRTRAACRGVGRALPRRQTSGAPARQTSGAPARLAAALPARAFFSNLPLGFHFPTHTQPKTPGPILYKSTEAAMFAVAAEQGRSSRLPLGEFILIARGGERQPAPPLLPLCHSLMPLSHPPAHTQTASP